MDFYDIMIRHNIITGNHKNGTTTIIKGTNRDV
jgi:hypothetical protein